MVMALLSVGARAAGDASDVLACVRGNVPSGPTVSTVEVTTTDPAAEQSNTLAGRIVAARRSSDEQGESRLWAMLRVDKPERLKGAAYLVREVGNKLRDEMFVYLPAVGRVRRITGSFANKPLLGTTFSYFDFKQIWNAFGDLTPVALGESADKARIHGRSVSKLHLHTQPDTEIDYGTVAVWVDRESCLPLRVDFKSDGQVIKRFTVPKGGIAQSDGRRYLSRIRMRDLTEDVVSVMRIESVNSLDKAAQPLFDPESFYKQQ